MIERVDTWIYISSTNVKSIEMKRISCQMQHTGPDLHQNETAERDYCSCHNTVYMYTFKSYKLALKKEVLIRTMLCLRKNIIIALRKRMYMTS